ncbi:helix-turn-helix domain-containing protein [Carnobacterium maltaromaticum]|uniref:helix-turn-helix domain-containing protein n=1 Tax=Carnobacterium maltaromaticum TaxID=2751 RepID=UPI0039BE62B0
MRLNEQIEIERKNKGLSKKKLVQIIEESIGLTFQVETIKRWELGTSSIDPKVLAFLSELYDVSIEDLVSEEIEPIMNNGERYYRFGKDISDYCSVENIAEFVNKYEVVQSSDWVVTPKYDLIMRCYEDHLKIEDNGYYNCTAAYDFCKRWMVDNKRSYNEEELHRRIYDDSAGYLGVKEKRDPVNHLDLLEEFGQMSIK